MANFCDYEVRVIGTKKAGLMVYASMPCIDEKDVVMDKKQGSNTVFGFTGACKWSVNFGVTDKLNKVNVAGMTESEIAENGTDYWGYSMRAKSEAFGCEIMVHYWSEESGFDQFDHYKNGKVIKQRKIEYNYEEENVFDWDKTEFVGHEGEYDESVNGEERDKELMAKLMGLGGMMTPSEPDMSEEDIEKISEFTGKVNDLLDQIERVAAENGIDLDSNPIGETGFDMYNWTFTEGKTVKGDGWTIAIPDGFVRINSSDVEPGTGKKRLFELVPVTYKDEDDVDKIPVRILPGAVQEGKGLGDNWMVHPDARAGVVGIMGAATAQFMAQFTGRAPGLLSVGWDDVAAYIMVNDTSGGSFSYQCSVFTENKNHQLRVQTQFMRDKQKHLLDTSVQAWLKTMHFDKPNKACPKKTMFDESACYNELLKGKTTKFETAIEQAHKEYNVSVNGKIKMLEFMGDNGLLDDYTENTITELLEAGMAVKEFYLEKANDIISKLQKNSVANDVLCKVLKKLHDLDEDCTYLNFNDKKIKINVSSRVKEIRKEWEGIEIGAKGKEKIDRKEKEAKRQEEKRKAKDIADKEMAEKMKAWEKKVETLKKNREKEEKERTKELETDAANKKEELKKDYDKELSECNEEIALVKKHLEDVNRELPTLGILKFSRKKKLTLAIEQDEIRINKLEHHLSSIEMDYKNGVERCNGTLKTDLKALQIEMDGKYIIPDSPKEIERKKIELEKQRKREREEAKRKKEEEEYRRAHMTADERLKEQLRVAILDAVCACGPCTIIEMQHYSYELGQVSNQKVSAVVRELVSEGILEKGVDKKKSVYTIA